MFNRVLNTSLLLHYLSFLPYRSISFHRSRKKSEAYSEPCQTSKMKCFAKIINGLKLLTIFAKRSILDVWTFFWKYYQKNTYLICKCFARVLRLLTFIRNFFFCVSYIAVNYNVISFTTFKTKIFWELSETCDIWNTLAQNIKSRKSNGCSFTSSLSNAGGIDNW